MRLLAALFVLATGGAAAETSVWIIGGGSGIEGAEVQIEQNTRWLQRLLHERGLEVRTYFALGDSPGKDVSFWLDPDADDAIGIAALARIFGDLQSTGLNYRRHELDAIAGSTRRDLLVRALEQDFAAVARGTDVLVVYHGHGGLGSDDGRDNYLRLWDGGRLAVAEVDRILDLIPGDGTTRFVMPQCYSGAFQSLVRNGDGRLASPVGQRCGFMSHSSLEQSEGCGLDPDESGYRDYASFFFAGLTGESRAGGRIDLESIDIDGNERISFREAHFHALAEAHSIDLARATSETYLTEWTPWYLDWDASIDGRDSIYWDLAERVGARMGGSLAAADLEARRKELLDRLARARDSREEADARIAAAQAELKTALLLRWPELMHPYSSGYHAVIDTHWADIERQIRADGRYLALLAAETERAATRSEERDLRRHLTQIDKIYRLKQLARLDTAMHVHGSQRARDEYAALVACESGYLETAGAVPPTSANTRSRSAQDTGFMR